MDHYFKPDWSPDTLRSYNYPAHFAIFKKDLLLSAGAFREGFEGSQDYDLILRISEQAIKDNSFTENTLSLENTDKDFYCGDLNC